MLNMLAKSMMIMLGIVIKVRLRLCKVKAIPDSAVTCYITFAEGLDIPDYALKRLLNHKMSNDVTARYIINDVECLRVPMQKINDYILKTVEVSPTGRAMYHDDPDYQLRCRPSLSVAIAEKLLASINQSDTTDPNWRNNIFAQFPSSLA